MPPASRGKPPLPSGNESVFDGRSPVAADFSSDMPRADSRYRVDLKDQPVSEQRREEKFRVC
jgi:hypothetical protein